MTETVSSVAAAGVAAMPATSAVARATPIPCAAVRRVERARRASMLVLLILRDEAEEAWRVRCVPG
jgi:hypothetical protein